jgi:hypothetical protein
MVFRVIYFFAGRWKFCGVIFLIKLVFYFFDHRFNFFNDDFDDCFVHSENERSIQKSVESRRSFNEI